MGEKPRYKSTFVDRHRADAEAYFRAAAASISVLGISLLAFVLAAGKLSPGLVAGCLAASVLVGGTALVSAKSAGWTWKRLMMDGTSTPYIEQYSYQQSLVMQGRVDDALASFESIITEQPSAIDPRLRAAELYDREKKNFQRAAALFREVQRLESVSSGQFVYVTNRLVDLYAGPLGDPGCALVELRRLIDRCPGTPAAAHARSALARMKTPMSS